jgi:peptidoglycan/LPS O-acetylase OafA/YrhL
MGIYVLKNCGCVTTTTWCTEVYGFVWGIILCKQKDTFIAYMNKNWLKKCIGLCVIAGVLGVSYLKFKPVIFFGDYLLKILLGISITAFMLAMNVHIKIGNKVSRFLGNISYEVYLLHGIVFGLISYIIPQINSGMFIVLGIVITVGISVVVHEMGKAILKVI